MSGIPTQGGTKIIIEFAGSEGEKQTSAPSPASPAPVDNQSKDAVDGDKNGQVKLSLAINVAKTVGTQAVNAAVSNIGLATGNYYMQQQAQRTVSGIQSVVGLAMSFTNPVTAITAIAGLGIQAAAETYQQNKEREIANYQAEQYAKRLGYTRDRR